MSRENQYFDVGAWCGFVVFGVSKASGPDFFAG